MILDVGCGGTPRGDVNCDVHKTTSPHDSFPINPKETKNFVRCDAHKLPFQSNSFLIVHASHLLEHIHDPLKALFEMKRVARKVVYLRIPNYVTVRQERLEHIYGWSKSTFENFLHVAFNDVVVYPPRLNPDREMCLAHGRILSGMKLLRRLVNTFMLYVEERELVAICYQ